MTVHTLTRALPAPSNVLSQIAHAHQVWTSRRALRGLSDAQLADVGLTRAQALSEAARPFWDA